MNTPDADTTPRAQADRLIDQHLRWALAPGLIPIPLLDLAALGGLQLNLLRTLAGVYEVPFTPELGRSALGALLGSAFPVSLSANMGSLIKGGPILGWLVGGATVALTGAASTYALGKVFVQHFESGNTLLTFDAERVREHYRQEFKQRQAELMQERMGRRP